MYFALYSFYEISNQLSYLMLMRNLKLFIYFNLWGNYSLYGKLYYKYI